MSSDSEPSAEHTESAPRSSTDELVDALQAMTDLYIKEHGCFPLGHEARDKKAHAVASEAYRLLELHGRMPSVFIPGNEWPHELNGHRHLTPAEFRALYENQMPSPEPCSQGEGKQPERPRRHPALERAEVYEP
jgi:hypothetical protein